jgi:hypothetical protein
MQKRKINLQNKCGWFYVIQLSHNNRWGFGITLNAELRLRKGYCNPSAEKQKFSHLYYGTYTQIKALERHLKHEWNDKMLVLYKEKLEWFDTKHNITGKEVVDFVESRCRAVYPEIYRIKSDHLPFEPSNYFKSIKDDPEKYLEHI